jgi:Amt family ammonium transporter
MLSAVSPDVSNAITASGGTTAWLLTSAALVLFMTPGLAFFYGGMTRSKSVLNMLMMSFSAIGVVTVLWVLYGYTLAFGTDAQGGLVGNLDNLGLKATTTASVTNGLYDYVFIAFQLMFAIITLALISGAIAERMKFGSWILFSILWISIVYFPVAHWVFAFGTPAPTDASGAVTGPVGAGAASSYVAGTGGWIVSKLGALDFAGGTAVHINAGAAGLALVLVLGKRKGFRTDPMRPHNLPLVLIGTGILWFGWFGFNAGSALVANGLAGAAFVNTQVATATAALAWIGTERLRDGHATTLGIASGAVAGLVAITPACGSVTPMGAILVGAVAGGLCCIAVTFKHRMGYDDALDVVGVHLVGGLAGTLMIGLVASDSTTGSKELRGLFYGGGFAQLGRQTVAALAVLAFSFLATLVIALVVKAVMGLRVSEDEEVVGIDQVTHAETAYELLGGLGATSGMPAQPLGATRPARAEVSS